MKFRSFSAFFVLFAASVGAFAQDSSPTKEAPPDPPLMGNAPADCQWTITYTPKVPEKEAVTPEDIGLRKMRWQYSPVVLSKNVLKLGGQTVILTNYEAGMKSEGWIIGRYYYQLPMRPGASMRMDSRGQGDFPDISGVTADNFRGTVDLKGIKAHLYEADAPEAHPGPSPAATPRSDVPATSGVKPSHRRVYIDAKTRLPLLVDTGDTIVTYKYAGPPASLPPPNDRIKEIMREAAPKKH